MTNKTPKLLVDALGAIDAVRDFVSGVSLAQYFADKMRRSAVERQLEILGEACSRLVKLEPTWVKTVTNLKLAIDLRNRSTGPDYWGFSCKLILRSMDG